MTQEKFPERTAYKVPRAEWQGDQLSCTRFALLSALEALAAHVGPPIELSSRFLWWYTDKQHLSIESAVDTLNRVGVCSEELYPYVTDQATQEVKDLHIGPSFEALLDALSRKYFVEVERIAGKTEIMRALSLGQRIVTIRAYANGWEHAEAGCNYDEDKGVQLWGSVGALFWEPWESFTDGTITQVWAITKAPFPMIRHYAYTPESEPTFDGETLKIAKARVYKGWPTPSDFVTDVAIKFASYGAVQVDDPKVTGREVIYFETTKRLHLPVLMVGDKRYEKVSLTAPVVESLILGAA